MTQLANQPTQCGLPRPKQLLSGLCHLAIVLTVGILCKGLAVLQRKGCVFVFLLILFVAFPHASLAASVTALTLEEATQSLSVQPTKGQPNLSLAVVDSVDILDSADVLDSASIPADQVDQFATAYLEVLQLLSNRETELPASETIAEALKVQQSIESEAIALIESNGLTMPEYMQILSLASQDATFRDKVLGRMDESIKE